MLVASLASTSKATESQPPTGPFIGGVFGPLVDGGTLSVLGHGFGEHELDIESVLGPRSWIETNGPGTRFPAMADAEGWSNGQQCFKGSFISDDTAWSGSHSIRTYVGDRADGLCDNEHCWQGAYNFDHGKPFQRVFASFRVRFDPVDLPDERTQWKLWRVNATGINGRNSSEEVYNRLRFTHGGRGYYDWGTALYCMLDCDTSPLNFSDQFCAQKLVPDPAWSDPPPSGMLHYYAHYHHHVGSQHVGFENTMPAAETWNRIDVFLEASDEDAFNGAYTLHIQRPDELRKLLVNFTGLATHRSEVCRPGTEGPWRYWVFQNYVDDNGGSFASERADVYIDDIYLQFGTRSRVEIGDQPSYEACKSLEVQLPRAWSDQSITLELNRGALPTGTRLFMFVIRDDGHVSDGFPITLD